MSDRIPDKNIKAALISQSSIARQHALDYYANSFSQDSDILPLVLKAITEFGWSGAYKAYYGLESLHLNEESFIWAIQRVKKGDVPLYEGVYGSEIAPHRLLARADPILLKKHESTVLSLGKLDQSCREEIVQRLALLEVDPVTCLMALEKLGALCYKDKDLNSAHTEGRALIEAAARNPDICADWVVDNLSEEPITNWDNPKAFIELMAIQLAGVIKVERAIPQLISKLNGFEKTDFYAPETSSLALIKVGGKTVIEAIKRSIETGMLDSQAYTSAAGILGCIHSDLSLGASMDLFRSKSLGIKSCYADAALKQYSPSATKEIAQFLANISVQETPYQTVKDLAELTFQLIASAHITNSRQIEIPNWMDEYRANGLWD